MSTKRMLIDASHPEETRVVIANGNRLEDFDVESETRKQLKGNIYLAKVTRVEPSLQACFVDYGGNRHGFLAFNEIHPDYYQIPIADREALVAEHQELEAEAHDDDEGGGEGVEVLGGEDEEIPARRPVNLRRQYKIQEVIKRRQVLLVQVVKEERGNKGAALTTYLSLAGRYCVLMPNTARGGGISRKIAQSPDRKRLKSILGELEIPQGMAVIVRTAGSKRTKAEIRRDYDYLMRLWTEVREKTLKSMAPCLVHAEGDVVKRAIRDLYVKEIDEIIVEGGDAYRAAKDFMKLLIPSHAKKVQPHPEGGVPLFQQFQVENQLHAMHEPEVQLRSGGYIVINPTEALVSIDVNSGRATKERNIEETALKTNMEAAEEIARQLRLRDLAGLIVIDFIDMEVSRNQAKVERALKDAMRHDRARIQIGRISPFGLLEMSRQRLRPSLHETSMEACPHCGGTGVRRSTESTALQMLRVLGEEGQRGKYKALTLHTPTSVALYLFNNKRAAIADLETRYNLTVRIEADDDLIPPDHRIVRINADGVQSQAQPQQQQPQQQQPAQAEQPQRHAESRQESDEDGGEEEGGRRRRRRRRGRRRRGGEGHDRQEHQDQQELHDQAADAADDHEVADDLEDADDEAAEARPEGGAPAGDGEGQPKRRRRGRRGGRRRRRSEEGTVAGPSGAMTAAADEAPPASESTEQQGPPLLSGPEAPALLAGPADNANDTDAGDEGAAEAEAAVPEAESKPSRRRRKADGDGKSRRRGRGKAAESSAEDIEADASAEATSSEEAPSEESAAEAAAPAGGNGSAEPEPAPQPAAPEVEPAKAATEAEEASESAKTVVIDVGTKTDGVSARKGWWNRLAE